MSYNGFFGIQFFKIVPFYLAATDASATVLHDEHLLKEACFFHKFCISFNCFSSNWIRLLKSTDWIYKNGWILLIHWNLLVRKRSVWKHYGNQIKLMWIAYMKSSKSTKRHGRSLIYMQVEIIFIQGCQVCWFFSFKSVEMLNFVIFVRNIMEN